MPDYNLFHGERLLGTLTRTDGDMPWELGTFEPVPAFEEFRPLFDRELTLLNADRMDEWETAWGEIAALGLRLEPRSRSSFYTSRGRGCGGGTE